MKHSIGLKTHADFCSTTGMPEAAVHATREEALLMATPVEDGALSISAALCEVEYGIVGVTFNDTMD